MLVKFVGGPLHGTEREIADDINEIAMPILRDNYGNITKSIRYVKPKTNEFVFVDEVIIPNEPVSIAEPIPITTVRTNNFTFELTSIDPPETRGHNDQTDWCYQYVTVKSRHPCYLDGKMIFKIWSFQNDYSVEFDSETKYGLAYVDLKRHWYITDFVYGLGQILKQNGFV